MLTIRTITLSILGLFFGPFCLADESPPTPDQVRFFETKVRPVLAENCFKCHGPEKQKGGLRLDSKAAMWQGGDSGPAIERDEPKASLILEAIAYVGLEMPPTGKLPDDQISTLTRWVEMGAPWPESGSASTAASSTTSKITDEDRAWWSFQPVREPVAPNTGDPWARNAIDEFVLRKLKTEGLAPAPQAEKVSLVRRLYQDMLGLPPTPAEIDCFLTDDSSNAYETLVERVLASPRYGGRWARYWLDLVRYADSDGYRIDHDRPNAWRYRDYVIRSFNQDKPYDRFVQEQIAGDEMFPGDTEALIATGYLRHWIYEYNNRDARGQWSLILNDITDTTSDVFLGLGVQCARCHNHKFDPILQKDYYRLQAFFAGIIPDDERPLASPEETSDYRRKLADWEAKTADLRSQIEEIESRYRDIAANDGITKFPKDIQELINKPVGERAPLEHQVAQLAYRQIDYEYSRLDTKLKGKDKENLIALRKQLAAFKSDKPKPLPMAMVVTDVGPEAPPTFIPKKGPEPIEPGFPTIFEESPAKIERIPSAPNSTGRRSALAQWLTRPENPLSTRVIVNRVWQQHFGRGLAANSSDFGKLGEAPSHPELLDWLTAKFIQNGWSLKQLHRQILTSATYRQSAHNPQADVCRLKDPENRFYWRGNTRRLSAEQVRDSVLAVTGELDQTSGGPGVNSKDPRLSIYTKLLRNTRDPLLDVFDLPLAFNSTPSRDTTTTPLQSLFLINSQVMLLRAQAFAKRLEREAGNDPVRNIELAYRLAFGRTPTQGELASAKGFLQDQAKRVDPEEAGSAAASFLHEKLPYRDGQAAMVSPGSPQLKFEVPHHALLGEGNFTLESFFLLRSIDEGSVVRTIAAKWDGDVKAPGWAFGVTGKGSRRKPQTLVLQLVGSKLDETVGEEAIFSDQHIQLDRPYFAAVSVKLAKSEPGLVTFYLKDLSNDDEPLLTAKVPTSITGEFANKLPLTLGGRSGKMEGHFDGLIDDVRFSDETLDVEQLLFTSEGANRNALGYWKFESEPNVFKDFTGHGLDIKPTARVKLKVDPWQAALVDFCHILLNSNEFLYID